MWIWSSGDTILYRRRSWELYAKIIWLYFDSIWLDVVKMNWVSLEFPRQSLIQRTEERDGENVRWMFCSCPAWKRRGWFILLRIKDLRKMNVWMAVRWHAIKRSFASTEREKDLLFDTCSIFEMRSYWISSVTIESCLYIGWDMTNWRIQLAFVNRVPSNQFNRRTRQGKSGWPLMISLRKSRDVWHFHNERRISLLSQHDVDERNSDSLRYESSKTLRDSI